MPFVVGWILALFSKSLVRFLERRVKLVRRHGSMLIIIAALAIVIGLFYGVGSLWFYLGKGKGFLRMHRKYIRV